MIYSPHVIADAYDAVPPAFTYGGTDVPRGTYPSPVAESWENESGHFPEFDGNLDRRTATSLPIVAEFEAVGGQAGLIGRTLSDDFANGRVGTRFNTFQHRQRVLHHFTARLEAMDEAATVSNLIQDDMPAVIADY